MPSGLICLVRAFYQFFCTMFWQSKAIYSLHDDSMQPGYCTNPEPVAQTRWEFACKPSERSTRSYCCDAQKYFLCTVKSAIIQKYLIMEPPEK